MYRMLMKVNAIDSTIIFIFMNQARGGDGHYTQVAGLQLESGFFLRELWSGASNDEGCGCK